MGIVVSGTVVVSPATGGSSVGFGVGAPGASEAVAVGVGDFVGLALAAAVVATATAVGDADGAATVPPHAAMNIAAAMIARLADRAPIVFLPLAMGETYPARAAGGSAVPRTERASGGTRS